MSLSIQELSQPVSEEMPSGENLEYDADYREMESLAQPKAEGMVEGRSDADNEPDWKGVARIAGELSSRTRDLRVQVYAALASIHTVGLPGFRDNLEVLKIYLRDFWGSVHPQLDPDDDNDPMLRMGTLQMLNDHANITLALERVKLVELKGLGQFGVREVELAQGKETPVKDEPVPDVNGIREAFVRTDSEHLEKIRTAVKESIALLSDIVDVWNEKAGDYEGIGFEVAVKALKKISAVINEFSPDPAGNSADEEGFAGGGVGPAAVSGVSGAINSRPDVVRVLDRICEYYSVHEPSSPIPLLLRRAQRLVEKSFMEILEDMVPDAVSQAKIVSGSSNDG